MANHGYNIFLDCIFTPLLQPALTSFIAHLWLSITFVSEKTNQGQGTCFKDQITVMAHDWYSASNSGGNLLLTWKI